jgi:hypothetical protein
MTFTDAERAAWFPPNQEGQEALNQIKQTLRDEALVRLADLNRRINASDSPKEREQLKQQKFQWMVFVV